MKNLRINNKLLYNIVAYATIITISTTGGTLAAVGVSKLLPEEKPQICGNTAYIDDQDIFINDTGEYCKPYDIGEHEIVISNSNHNIYKEVPGYTINEVELNKSLGKDTIKYTNALPVIAVGELNDDGTIEFNEFGLVQEKEKRK